ncbi:MAG TPA: hypothetical protein VHP33_28825 [Polyangiaceae bacterium]|nr:hypothetical protein [Polyangiaceae bacterium]
MKDLRPLASVSLFALALGCSSEAIDSPDDGPETPSLQVESVTPELVYAPQAKVKLSATALAFNPTIEGELWVALRQFPSGLPCTQEVDSGCAALPGAMAVVSDATSAMPSAVIKEDGNSWHFMRRPAAMAWGDEALFATCGEALTDNYEDDDIPYAGPVLWSSDPAIFGVEPLPEQNGTHLDMLHETPYCMGIAHESANAYWAFNGLAGSLDRVDFHAPHQIGGENHSDGEVHRYITGQLLRVPEVPSHLVYDKTRSLVYVVDTGHARVLSVDPSTATPGDEITKYELLAASGAMDGAGVSALIPAGQLERPSGIAFADDVLYVTDNATSRIHTFDVTGRALRLFDTGLPAGTLAGITLGPDDSLYLTDLLTGSAYRVDVPVE